MLIHWAKIHEKLSVKWINWSMLLNIEKTCKFQNKTNKPKTSKQTNKKRKKKISNMILNLLKLQQASIYINVIYTLCQWEYSGCTQLWVCLVKSRYSGKKIGSKKINELKDILMRGKVFNCYIYLQYSLKIWELFILNAFYSPQ